MTNNREYEEGAAGTNKGKKSDPLTEYEDRAHESRKN